MPCGGLRTLNLRDNNLENAEVRALVAVLLATEEDTLTMLDLSNNPISLAGGSALMDLLARAGRELWACHGAVERCPTAFETFFF